MSDYQGFKRAVRKPNLDSALRRFLRRIKAFDRRKDMRFGFTAPLECSCLYSQSGRKQECRASALDISRGGMLVLSAGNKIQPGTEAEFIFKGLAGSAVSVSGRIMRTFRHHAEKWYFAGIKFSDKKQPGVAFLLLSSSRPL